MSRIIPLADARIGDLVEFKRSGPLAFVLALFLKLYDPSYDMWGWHLAVISDINYESFYIIEAVAEGVVISDLIKKYCK